MRQRIHSILALAGLLTIGACATLNSERSVAQQQALTRLGFVEVNEGWELNLGRRLSFAVDESTLNADAYAMVKEIAQVLLAVGVELLDYLDYGEHGVPHLLHLKRVRQAQANDHRVRILDDACVG